VGLRTAFSGTAAKIGYDQLSAHEIRYRELASIEASLNYVAASPERLRTYAFDPPAGTLQSNAIFEPHRVRIFDMRPIAPKLSLDREGFALLKKATAVQDFSDEDAVKTVYYPEAEALLRDHTGADRVVIFDHTVRRRLAGAIDRTSGVPRQPVLRVHNDYTENSGPQRVRDLLGAEAESLLQKRFAIINVWRPLQGPVRDAPLAVCDARSANPGDFVASDLIYRDRVGETYVVKYNPNHHWFYTPDMTEDEVWLLKCYDSSRDGTARFVPHTAFDDPAAPLNIPPRESIELRALIFYGSNQKI